MKFNRRLRRAAVMFVVFVFGIVVAIVANYQLSGIWALLYGFAIVTWITLSDWFQESRFIEISEMLKKAKQQLKK